MSLDEAAVRAANAWATDPWVASAAHWLSSPWVLLMVSLVLAAGGQRWRQWRALVVVALAVGAADATSAGLLKPLVDRPRPCRVHADLVRVDPCGVGESFPSAHAANGFAFATAASPLVARAAPALFVLATLVAGSRVVLGVHYVSDVVAGALLGLIIGAGARWWIRRSTTTTRPPSDPTSTSAPDHPAP